MTTTLTKPVHDFGLTELVCPEHPAADVVFVHGLNGHPEKTWSTRRPDVFWPRDLLDKDASAHHFRVLTYGYDAQVVAFTDGTTRDNIHSHAETLATRLETNRGRRRCLDRPIIFVCHSLGGLVVKRMLIYCSQALRHETRSTFVSTYGVIFMGTPHNGSDLAKWGSTLQRICATALPRKFFETAPQLVKTLETKNETLQVINQQFSELTPRFELFFFHETKPMDLGATRARVVEEDSAVLQLPGVGRSSINKDHSSMVKFADAEDPDYEAVAYAISSYADGAPAKIAARWNAEIRDNQLRLEDQAKELLVAGGRLRNPSVASTSPHISQPSSIETSMASIRRIEAAPAQASQEPPLVVPDSQLFRPNQVFVGFKVELERLDRKLKKKGGKSERGSVAVVISGAPGAGKSHLARQYMYLHRDEHPVGSFWLDCKSGESIKASFLSIGQKLGCLENINLNDNDPNDSVVTTVKDYLQGQRGWLMVFDGILSQTSDIETELENFKDYIIDSPGNHIIYTCADPTLAKRHRLLEPSEVTLHPLTRLDGRALLYRSLGIRKGDKNLDKIADRLCQDYAYLPLGIHAAAHVLIAYQRPLATYRSRSIAPDRRLMEPFLEILSVLQRNSLHDAVTLLKLLSFFYHRVPVVLIHFAADWLLERWELDVRSTHPSIGSSVNKSLDNTIAVLLRYGLIERHFVEPSIPTPEQGSSPETSRSSTLVKSTELHAAQSGLVSTTDEDSSSTAELVLHQEPTDDESVGSIPRRIETLTMHTVVQTIFRDHIKASDDNLQNYHTWLRLACEYLHASYQEANAKTGPAGLTNLADVREFKTHAEHLLDLINPERNRAPNYLIETRHSLRIFVGKLNRAVQNCSPSQCSSTSGRGPRSVFEQWASLENGETGSPDLGLSRYETWSRPQHNLVSPTARHLPRSPSELDLTVPDHYPVDDGYTADSEHPAPASRLLQYSDARPEVFRSGSISSNADRLMYSPRVQSIGRRDLGEFRPAALVGTIENRAIEAESPPPRPRSSSTSSWITNILRPQRAPTSPAQEALKSLQLKASHSPPRPQVANDLEPAPLSERSVNVPTTATLSPPNDVVPSFAAEPVPMARQHFRTVSSSPRLLHSVLANQAANQFVPAPPAIEEKITITRRIPQDYAVIPGTVLAPTETYPGGYYSSVPMSRDTSGGSHASFTSMPGYDELNGGSASTDYLGLPVHQAPMLPTIDSHLRSDMARRRSSGLDNLGQPIEVESPPIQQTKPSVDVISPGARNDQGGTSAQLNLADAGSPSLL